MPKAKTTHEFIRDAQLKYGDRYDYSKVHYIGNKKKIEIICTQHGSFYQTPNDHLGGHQCKRCSEEAHINYNLKELTKAENKTKLVDFYILNLFSDTENFIKIGISKQYKKRHMNIKTKSGYNYKVLLVVPLCLGESLPIEREVLAVLKSDYKYIPTVKFPGYKECLSLNASDLILEKVKDYLISKTGKSSIVGKILDYEYGK